MEEQSIDSSRGGGLAMVFVDQPGRPLSSVETVEKVGTSSYKPIGSLCAGVALDGLSQYSTTHRTAIDVARNPNENWKACPTGSGLQCTCRDERNDEAARAWNGMYSNSVDGSINPQWTESKPSVLSSYLLRYPRQSSSVPLRDSYRERKKFWLVLQAGTTGSCKTAKSLVDFCASANRCGCM